MSTVDYVDFQTVTAPWKALALLIKVLALLPQALALNDFHMLFYFSEKSLLISNWHFALFYYVQHKHSEDYFITLHMIFMFKDLPCH